LAVVARPGMGRHARGSALRGAAVVTWLGLRMARLGRRGGQGGDRLDRRQGWARLGLGTVMVWLGGLGRFRLIPAL
jgi:hypothetical protein